VDEVVRLEAPKLHLAVKTLQELLQRRTVNVESVTDVQVELAGARGGDQFLKGDSVLIHEWREGMHLVDGSREIGQKL